jgi:hypothetical protein
MSVSLTDKVIEMLLSRFICKLEIENWREIPSKPGIGFSESDNKQVYDDVMNCGKAMAFSDMRGWDWNTKPWMMDDEARSCIYLCDDSSEVWSHLLKAKAILEYGSIYQFSDGTLVAPNYEGIVNSGKSRTSRGNSWMRNRVADLIGSEKALTAGDDCVEHEVKDAIAKYREYGIVCKSYERAVDSFEFCSHMYTNTGAYAVNWEKMVMNLLHQDPKDFQSFLQTMVGFQAELSSRPDYERILELVTSVGYYEVEGPHYNVE